MIIEKCLFCDNSYTKISECSLNSIYNDLFLFECMKCDYMFLAEVKSKNVDNNVPVAYLRSKSKSDLILNFKQPNKVTIVKEGKILFSSNIDNINGYKLINFFLKFRDSEELKVLF